MIRFLSLLAVVLALLAEPLSAASLSTTSSGPEIPTVVSYLLLGLGAIGAVLGTGALTLADWAKRTDPNGKVPTIVELLAQTNEILLDMRWVEGNLVTGERTTVRTGLPAVFWRLLNQGVPSSKSKTAQIDEQTGNLEAWSEVDKKIAELGGNVNAVRLSEGMAFIEAMNQEMAQTLFYGNHGLAPEEFTGLAPRYSSLSAGNASNILPGGGAGSDNSSIWLINWGEQTLKGIFPKGSKAGLQHDDYGEQTVEMTTGIGGSRMRAYQERWTWEAGIALKDWRHAVRICNIDISNLVAKVSAADLIELMIKAIHRIPSMGMGKPAFYMNRTVFQMLDIQRRDDVIAGGGITYDNVDGIMRPTFRGIPIARSDALLETEAAVV